MGLKSLSSASQVAFRYPAKDCRRQGDLCTVTTRTKYQGARARHKATVTCKLEAEKVTWEAWQEPALEDLLLYLLLPFLISLYSGKAFGHAILA